MMTTAMNALPTLSMATGAISIAALSVLAWGDPKRLRIAQRLARAKTRSPLSRTRRRLLAALSLLPGLTLVLLGDWAAFLIWLGIVGAAGWGLSWWLAPTPPATKKHHDATR